jgi:hypothetical protein
MKSKVTIPKASKALLRLNPSGPVRCPLCFDVAAVVFTVIRTQTSVGKAYLCMECYELLKELLPIGVSAVSPWVFLETKVMSAPRKKGGKHASSRI